MTTTVRLDEDAVEGVLVWGLDPRYCHCEIGSAGLPRRYQREAEALLAWAQHAPTDPDGDRVHDIHEARDGIALLVLRAGRGDRFLADSVTTANEAWGVDTPKDGTDGAEVYRLRTSLERIAHRGVIVAAARIAGLAVADRVAEAGADDVAALARRIAEDLFPPHARPGSAAPPRDLGMRLRRAATDWWAPDVPGLRELARVAAPPAGGSFWACCVALIRTEMRGGRVGTGSERSRIGRARAALVGV